MDPAVRPISTLGTSYVMLDQPPLLFYGLWTKKNNSTLIHQRHNNSSLTHQRHNNPLSISSCSTMIFLRKVKGFGWCLRLWINQCSYDPPEHCGHDPDYFFDSTAIHHINEYKEGLDEIWDNGTSGLKIEVCPRELLRLDLNLQFRSYPSNLVFSSVFFGWRHCLKGRHRPWSFSQISKITCWFHCSYESCRA